MVDPCRILYKRTFVTLCQKKENPTIRLGFNTSSSLDFFLSHHVFCPFDDRLPNPTVAIRREQHAKSYYLRW